MTRLLVFLCVSLVTMGSFVGCGGGNNGNVPVAVQSPPAVVGPTCAPGQPNCINTFGGTGYVHLQGVLSGVDTGTAKNMMNNLNNPWGWSWSFCFGCYNYSTVDVFVSNNGGTIIPQMVLTLGGSQIGGQGAYYPTNNSTGSQISIQPWSTQVWKIDLVSPTALLDGSVPNIPNAQVLVNGKNFATTSLYRGF